ncbi:MAG: hypothetical protein JST65_10125 [Acidobacteria bacterium]|nr:hypothetical protein [Acidobacteriota bacterium]
MPDNAKDAESNQRLLNLAAKADAREGIRQGEEDIGAGRLHDADEVFRALRARYASRDRSRPDELT